MNRRKKSARTVSMPRGVMSVLACWAALFALLIRIPIHNELSESGQGYFAVALSWFLAFLIPGMGGMFYAVSRMVSLRVEKGSVRNAKRVVTVAFSAALLGGLILTAAFFFAAPYLTGKLCGVDMAVPAVKCLAFSILPICLMAVLMGGLDGLGFENTALTPLFAACVIFLCSGVWAAGACRAYGDNVGALLQNAEYGPAYAALGCAAGLAAASWAGFALSVAGWIYKKKSIRSIYGAQSGTTEHEKHMIRGVVNARLAGMLTVWIPVLCFCIQGALYCGQIKKEAGSMSDWGAYAGIMGSVLTIPMFFVILFAVRQIPGLKVSFERRNLKKSRAKLLILMRAAAVLTVFCAFIGAVLAEPLVGMFFGNAEGMAAKLLQAGAFTLIFWGLGASLAAVLWGMRQEKMVPLGLLIAGICMIASECAFFSFMEDKIMAVVWADFVWAVVLFVFCLLAVGRLEKIRINWIRVFLPPVIGGGLAALVCLFLSHFLGQSAPDTVVCLVCLFVGGILYFVAETALHGINPRILQEYPGGEKIYALAHLLRLM